MIDLILTLPVGALVSIGLFVGSLFFVAIVNIFH